MTEILTESFCERCGTRYTFESAAPRKSRIGLGRVRVLSKGMRNFVLSDDASFSEAMADARSEEEIAATAHQLDAFHQTFNFCLTCRQYTCGDCWNIGEGRCLTCAPIPGMELELPVAEVVPLIEVGVEPVAAEAANGHGAAEAWPDADLSSARLARALGMDEAEAAAVADVAPLAEADEASRAAIAAEGGADELDQELAGQLIGIAPGQSLEDAIAEYEARLAADEVSDAGELSEPVDATVSVPMAAAVIADTDTDDAPATGDHDADALAAMAAAAIAGLARDDATEAALEPEVAPEPVAAVEAAVEAEAEPEPVEAVEAAVEAEAEPEPVEAVEAAAEPEPEPVAAVEAAAEPEPEPVAAVEAAAEPEPEPVAMEPELVAPAPESQDEPAPVAAAAEHGTDAAPRDDVVPQPAWPTPSAPAATPAATPVAPLPDETAPPANPWLTVAPEDPGAPPQWPVAPAWSNVAGRRDAPATLAGRPLLPQADPSGLWAASAREVLTASAVPVPEAASAPTPTAQPCVSCGLSLSANARFCRRCGTRQG